MERVEIKTRRLAIRHPRRGGRLAWAAAATLAATFVATMVERHLTFPFDALWIVLSTWRVIPALLLALAAAQQKLLPRRGPGTVRVDGATLSVESSVARRSVPVSSVAEGWVERWPQGRAVLGLADGSEIDCELDPDAEGPALLSAAGVDPSRRVLRVGLGRWLPHVVTTVFLSAASTFGASIAASFFSGGLASALTFVAIVGSVAAYLFHDLRPADALLGADGLTVREHRVSQFVPWREVVGVTLEPAAVVLWRDRAWPLRVRVPPNDLARRNLIYERVQIALASRGEGFDATVALLNRNGRSLAEWRQSLAALASPTGNSGYRALPVTREDLNRVLADPTAPAERRIAAALALRSAEESGGADGPTRIRVAAEATANEPVRAALESIATGRGDDELVERALREGAAQQTRGR